MLAWYASVVWRQCPVMQRREAMERRTQCLSNLVLIAMLLVCLVEVRETIALEVGEKAPDFTLSSTMREKISLSQFQGKQFVLIEFYGADFAPV
jgi:peroxiredoxin Q/BCP